MYITVASGYGPPSRKRVETFEGDPNEIRSQLVSRFEDYGLTPAFLSRPLVASIAYMVSSHYYDVVALSPELRHEYQEIRGIKKTEESACALLAKGGADEVATIHAQLGHLPAFNRAVEAARFLAAGTAHDPQRLRSKLWEADGDEEKAALLHYGLEPSEKNLKALRAIQVFPFYKDEEEIPGESSVDAAFPEGEETAESVRAAYAAHAVEPIDLGGKHSKGAFLAKDNAQGRSWILKPGSGGDSPAAGEAEQPATPSEREAAFWQVVNAWGVGNYYPHTDLLLIDGKQYAAIEVLPSGYQSANDIRNDPAALRRLFTPFLQNGLLHRWGAIDWVLGNADRNYSNMLVRLDSSKTGPNPFNAEDVQLIDQGAAWCGVDFDPAHDRYSFVPGYLRFGCDGNFNNLSSDQKLEVLPRVSGEVEKSLRSWIAEIDLSKMVAIAKQYRVDPTGAEMRLASLKSLIAEQPADLAVNQLWCIGG